MDIVCCVVLVQKHRAVSTDHLGNVRATVSDMLMPRGSGVFDADLRTLTDYYPFGMTMPGRTLSSEDYRYGYNGKENDNEVKGEGNQQDYGFRIYDPRVARFLSVDPLFKIYPEFSPYSFAAASPIMFKEVDGQGFNGGFSIINNSSETIVVRGTSKTIESNARTGKIVENESRYVDVALKPGQRLLAYHESVKTADGRTLEKYTARVEDAAGKVVRSDVDAWDVDMIVIQPNQVFVQDFLRMKDGKWAVNKLRFGSTASTDGILLPNPKTGPGTIKLRPGLFDLWASPGDANEGYITITGDSTNLQVKPGGEWENKPSVDFGSGNGYLVEKNE